jgi:hypothetical protein
MPGQTTHPPRLLTPRPLTTEEISHFGRCGWVHLAGLISPAAAAAVLARALRFRGPLGVDTFLGEDIVLDSIAADYNHPSREDDLLRSLATHPILGQQTARLLDIPGLPVRLLVDTLVGTASPPLQQTRRERGGARRHSGSRDMWCDSDFHQGQSFLPIDRRAVSVRIALETTEVANTPLRFINGSHRYGLLGRAVTAEPRRQWPQLASCSQSGASALSPGDATMHASDIVRGYPQTGGHRPRGYVLVYVPADARYTGMPSSLTDGLGLTPTDPLEHEHFPRIG